MTALGSLQRLPRSKRHKEFPTFKLNFGLLEQQTHPNHSATPPTTSPPQTSPQHTRCPVALPTYLPRHSLLNSWLPSLCLGGLAARAETDCRLRSRLLLAFGPFARAQATCPHPHPHPRSAQQAALSNAVRCSSPAISPLAPQLLRCSASVPCPASDLSRPRGKRGSRVESMTV